MNPNRGWSGRPRTAPQELQCERNTTVRGRAPRCRTLVKAHANNSSAHCGAEGPPRQTVWKGIDRMRCTGQGPGQGRVNEHNTQAQASHHSWRAYLTSVGRGQAVVHPHTKSSPAMQAALLGYMYLQFHPHSTHHQQQTHHTREITV